MTVAPSPTSFIASNLSPDVSVVGFRHIGRFFRSLWPQKTATELAVRADISIRQAERVVGGHSGLSGGALIALLRDDHGGKVLKEVMRNSRAKWWRDVARAQQLAELRRAQEQQRRTIERLEQEAGE